MSGWRAVWISPLGADHGSQVTMGTAPWRDTRRAQSVRKRCSPLSHCWYQPTMRGRAPCSSVQLSIVDSPLAREKFETPR